MRIFILSALVALVLSLQGCATTPRTQSQVDEQRAEIQSMANQTLDQLYQQYPGTREMVRNAAGYAVFSDTGFKLMYGGGAHGKGVAVNSGTNQPVYMKMVELQPGLGFGIEKFRIVFIFDTTEALRAFITSGWEFGANAMAAVKSSAGGGGGQGGAVVSPGVTMFQLTERGAIVGISVTGAKYYPDDALN